MEDTQNSIETPGNIEEQSNTDENEPNTHEEYVKIIQE